MRREQVDWRAGDGSIPSQPIILLKFMEDFYEVNNGTFFPEEDPSEGQETCCCVPGDLSDGQIDGKQFTVIGRVGPPC